MEILSVFIGGALGALLRYFIYTQFKSFYLPTFLVNMLGCFIIGFCAYMFGRKPDNKYIKSLLTVGFAGGLTTFSTFALDLYRFITLGNFYGLLVYMLGSVLLGICLVSIGINFAYNVMVRIIRLKKNR